MNDELKPCPFCGGDFYFHEIEETGIEVRHNPIGDCPIEPLLGWYYTKEIALKTLNTRPIEAALRSQLAEKDAEVARLKLQLEEAGKALSGLGYTPSSDELPPEKPWIEQAAQTIKYIKENRANVDRLNP